MKIEQNPFSLYDFLGYFIPGSLLMYIIYFINFWDDNKIIDKVLSKLKTGDFDSYLPFIILAYVSGHLISFLSSYSIERFCLWRYSYPFRFLMDFKHEGYINIEVQKSGTILKRILLYIIILPIGIWDSILGLVFNMRYLRNRKFSKQTRDIVVRRLNTFVKKELNSNEEIDIEDPDNFSLIYHYTLERSNNHLNKFNNYVALYGFSRSISFLFVFVFWYAVIQTVSNNYWSWSMISFFIAISILSYLFFLGFCKFYRRYSIEVIMTFVTLDE